MQCEEVRERFADYVSDNIDGSIRFQIARHLGVCEPCRQELNDLKNLWVELGNIPLAEETTGTRTRFDEMLEPYMRPRRLQIWQVGVAAASLVVGIVIGYHLRPSTAPNTELAELRTELNQTRQMVVLSLMQQQAATDRLRGVNWSYQLQQPSTELLRGLLDTLMHDSNVNVRLATVDALRQFGNQPVVERGVVEALAHQQPPMVEVSLIDLAVDLRNRDSIDTLRQLTQDHTADQAVRDRAQKGLMELEER